MKKYIVKELNLLMVLLFIGLFVNTFGYGDFSVIKNSSYKVDSLEKYKSLNESKREISEKYRLIIRRSDYDNSSIKLNNYSSKIRRESSFSNHQDIIKKYDIPIYKILKKLIEKKRNTGIKFEDLVIIGENYTIVILFFEFYYDNDKNKVWIGNIEIDYYVS